MKALVLFYSMYGHIYQLANAVVEGVTQAGGIEAVLRKIPETLPVDVLKKMGADQVQKGWKDIPDATVADLAACDCLIIGSPTRFGGICGQVRQFLDRTGGLWAEGKMVGKIGAGFTSSGTQHGGQEITIFGSLYPFFLHQGMLISGLPYSFEGQSSMAEIIGCSPYAASCVAGGDGSRQPTATDLAGARYLGNPVATLTKKLRG